MFTWWFEYLWTTCPCWPAWSSYHFTHNLRQKAWKRECQWHYHYQYQEGLEMTCGCNYHASWLCQDQYFSVQEWNPYFVAVLQAYGIRLLFPSKCKMVLGKSSPFSFIVLALPCVQSSEEFAASALLRCTPSLSNQEYKYQTISSSASSEYGMRMQYGFSFWTRLSWKCLVSTYQSATTRGIYSYNSVEPLQCRWKPRLDPRSSLMHQNLDANESLFTSLFPCSQVRYNCFFWWNVSYSIRTTRIDLYTHWTFGVLN